MENIRIVDIIKDNIVTFSHASSGILYYNVKYNDDKYIFPVDMNNKEEVGNATFLNEDKAIYFTRYIKKSINSNEFFKVK